MEVLAFLGLVFTGAFLVTVGIATKRERPEVAAVAVAVVSLLLWLVYNINVITVAWNNLYLVLAAVPLWLLIGAGWSVFMWDRFCAEKRREYDEAAAASGRQPDLIRYMPVALQNKRRFATWILLWMFSIPVYIFGDMLRDLADYVMRRLNTVYSAIAYRHFRDVMPPKAAGE